MSEKILSTDEKALSVNLDDTKYGTFAEIGAGQEVVRHFFQAGATAGTVAKSMSAYDMKFSDEIYGHCDRYVSRQRVVQMLEHEYSLLEERLRDTRGERSTFFAFSNTVAAQSFRGGRDCHGWLGIRFQLNPKAAPSDIILHVRLLDETNLQQQDALGIIGVNLVYGAFFHRDNPREFIQSLGDNLGHDRIEVDMIQFLGAGFEEVDNRILSLMLVQEGLTRSALFNTEGNVCQPAEAFYKKSILVERGSFQPVNNVHIDMLRCARDRFCQLQDVDESEVCVLFELNLASIGEGKEIDLADFLSRVDTITALGHHVLISNYLEYYRLSSYLRTWTKKPLGIVLGLSNLADIFQEQYYENLGGGILEAFGRLFKQNVKLYVYPMTHSSFKKYQEIRRIPEDDAPLQLESLQGVPVITATSYRPATHLKPLYQYIMEHNFIESMDNFDPSCLDVVSRDTLSKIIYRDREWEKDVPSEVAEIIKTRKLWGYSD
jgi:hypothetical protein